MDSINLEDEYLWLASQRPTHLDWLNEVLDGDGCVRAVQNSLVITMTQHCYCKAVTIGVILS